jgi:hypothetical protein
MEVAKTGKGGEFLKALRKCSKKVDCDNCLYDKGKNYCDIMARLPYNAKKELLEIIEDLMEVSKMNDIKKQVAEKIKTLQIELSNHTLVMDTILNLEMQEKIEKKIEGTCKDCVYTITRVDDFKYPCSTCISNGGSLYNFMAED